MVLMQIVSVVGQDEIWRTLRFKLFESFFEINANVREKTIAPLVNGNLLNKDVAEKPLSAL